MKKGLTIAVATCLAACTWYSSQEHTPQKREENLPSECMYIGSPVFSIDVKTAAALPLKTEETPDTTEADVTAVSIELEIAEFTETEIPSGEEAYSSNNGLLGEIARADVKMPVSQYRYETADNLIEPEEVAAEPAILAIAAAPPVELPSSAAKEPSFTETKSTNTILAINEQPGAEVALAVSESESVDEMTEIVPEIADDVPSKTLQTFDAAPYMKTIAKTWRKAPKECIEAAKRIIGNAESVSREDLAEAWYRKGRAHRLLDEPLSAIKAHEMAASIVPESASYLNGYAWILSTVKPYKYRDHEKALVTAQKAVELSEHKSANYLDTLGRTLSMLGHHEEAFLAQKEAVSLSPGKKSFRSRLKKYESKLLVAD